MISVEFGLLDGGPLARGAGRAAEPLPAREERRRPPRAADHRRGAEPAPATLEQIRLLSNLETETAKLIQILLLGQPELDAKLESTQLRQLRQRIGVRWRLDRSRRRDARVRPAPAARGAGGERDLFSDRALREVYRRSRGVPRLVNLLCDRALLAGFAAGVRQIGPEFVGQAAREILGARRRRLARRWLWRSGAAAALLLAALAASALAWRQFAASPADGSPAAVSAAPATLGATTPGDAEEAG